MAAPNPQESLYSVLGVQKQATHEEIQAAFKKKAKELHPDVNKAPDAEEKFKRLVSAYEVLKDAEKRKRYDQFGSASARAQRRAERPPKQPRPGSRDGAPRPPPGFEDLGGLGFDESLGQNPFDYILRRSQQKKKRERDVQLTIPLEQAYNGTTLSITLEAPGTKEQQRFRIKIPQGAKEGDRLKLKEPNIVVTLHIEPHPKFELVDRDITTTVDIAPWEAVLGADVMVATPGPSVKLKVPPGTSSGQKLRLRGQGLPLKPGKEGEPGDLFVRVRVVVPKTATDKEKELWAELAKLSTFDPRAES